MEKLQLSCLPTQAGKTFVAIKQLLLNRLNDPNSLHIFFTMNDLINNSQTVYRAGEHIDHSNMAILSCRKFSKSYKHIHNVNQYNILCMKSEIQPNVIFTCCNSKRISHIQQIVETPQNADKTIYVYIDEMHKYISFARTFVDKLLQNIRVKKILALTATPQTLWKSGSLCWESIPLLKNEDPTFDSNYICLKDLAYVYTEWIDVDGEELTHRMMRPPKDVISYFKFVAEKYPEIFVKGSRVFIPANVKQYAHIRVREIIFEKFKYAVVVVLNSKEKSISFYDKTSCEMVSKKLSLKMEINQSIFQACIENDIQLCERSLCIVGFNCLGMGQTLMNERLGSFTSAIIGRPNITNDEMYQLYGRLTGRMRNWGSQYSQTVIYCNKESANIVREMEKCSLNAREKQGCANFTYNDYIEPIQDSDILRLFNNQQIRELASQRRKNKDISEEDKGFALFDTQQEAIDYALSEFEKSFRKRKSNEAPKHLQRKGKNRTKDELVGKMCGISSQTPIIMTVTDEYKWIVYWQKSLMNVE